MEDKLPYLANPQWVNAYSEPEDLRNFTKPEGHRDIVSERSEGTMAMARVHITAYF